MSTIVAPADVSLARVIAYVESNTNKYALRFEPEVYEHVRMNPTSEQVRLVRFISQANSCTTPTAEIIYSTSFGMFQLMGFNIYEAGGWTLSVGAYMDDLDEQKASFARFLESKKISFTWEELKNSKDSLEHFATEYNGPESVAYYVQRMGEAATQLNV
jgi:N-acetylmuramidase